MNYRNTKNTYYRTYNCGGYALGTFDWYTPYDDDDDSVFCRRWNDDDIDEILEDMTDIILNEFDGYIRQIHDISELTEGENAVAFRIGEDDFHFMLRHSNGHWYHKRGNQPIEAIRKNQVFSEEWGTGRLVTYTSAIVLFAVQREAIMNEQENF